MAPRKAPRKNIEKGQTSSGNFRRSERTKKSDEPQASTDEAKALGDEPTALDEAMNQMVVSDATQTVTASQNDNDNTTAGPSNSQNLTDEQETLSLQQEVSQLVAHQGIQNKLMKQMWDLSEKVMDMTVEQSKIHEKTTKQRKEMAKREKDLMAKLDKEIAKRDKDMAKRDEDDRAFRKEALTIIDKMIKEIEVLKRALKDMRPEA